METKHIHVDIQKADSSEYDARFVMSAVTPDRVQDTIDEKAYEPNIGKKLIALYQHDPDRPIGRWDNLRVEAGKLIGDLKVASTNLGMMVKQLIADGVPLGASIGFRGKGEPNKKGGIHFKELQLLECSVVSIPAHPAAMQIAKSFGYENLVADEAKDVGAVIKAAKELVGTERMSRVEAALYRANKALGK